MCGPETQGGGPLTITSVIPMSCAPGGGGGGVGGGGGTESWSHHLYDSSQSPRPAAAETLLPTFQAL